MGSGNTQSKNKTFHKKAIYLSKPGVVSCAGGNIEELWVAAVAGDNSKFLRITTLSGKSFWAGLVDEGKLFQKGKAEGRTKIEKLAATALVQIKDEVDFVKSTFDERRVGIFVGSCDNGTQLSVAAHKTFFETGSFPKGYNLEVQQAGSVTSFIKGFLELSGPAFTFSTACSSSSSAIFSAAQMLEAGLLDAAVVGGVDIASFTTLAGFDALKAISSDKTNPFSKNRSGITLGDGSAFFVMTKKSLGNVPVRLVGWGSSSDAFHATSPEPNGVGASTAMAKAFDKSTLLPYNIDYVNLHGTGTKLNDASESCAMKNIFGIAYPPCSSTKAITAHTLGAAGALEAAVCYKALLSEGMLPLHLWDGVKDESLPELNFVTKKMQQARRRVKTCLTNTFGFGGANVSLILARE